MEVGQILHNDPVALESSDFVDALITAIRSELARVYWNVNQKKWRGAGDGDIGGGVDPWDEEWKSMSYEPLPPGITWRPYYNWGGCPGDDDWDQSEADKPNFSFEGVEVFWYKHFGRSMNVNVVWSAEKWERWFNRCIQTIRAYETQSRNWNHGSNLCEYPDPNGAVPLDLDLADLRFLELLATIKKLESQINMMACVCIDVGRGKAPTVNPEDWRFCKEVKWVTMLGAHALTAPTKFRLR